VRDGLEWALGRECVLEKRSVADLWRLSLQNELGPLYAPASMLERA
jgi:hypothetical protein